MRRSLLLSLLAILALSLQAAIPAVWQAKYATCNGHKGAELKTALYRVISTHTQKSYDALWSCYETTDVHSDGTIWDMYSSVTDGVLLPTSHSVNYHVEGDVLNREHSVPSSWFGKKYPMYSDLFHVIPVDGYINNMRSNYPYGETSNPTKTSTGGFSKLGPCDAAIGYTGTVFEPNDEYKGDLARNYFYMVTCYEDNVATWVSDMFDGSTYPAFTTWALDLLVRWAKNDVVSQKEIDRNDAVFAIQANRNPFIDYPGLEQYVFGSKKDIPVILNPDGTISETDEEVIDDDSDADYYEEVTSTDQLVAGQQYIIVYPDGHKAMKRVESDFKGEDYSGHVKDGKIDISSLSNVCVLTLGGTTGAWTFAFTENNTNYYLQCNSKNSLTVSTTATANAQKWTITLSDTDPIKSNNVISDKTYYLQYNQSADYFRCYTSGQKSVKLYVHASESKPITVAAPTFSYDDESELIEGSTVSISSATTGATIKYSTDGGNTWTTGNSLTLGEIGSATIQAKAVLGDNESSIVEVTYTVKEAKTFTFAKVTSTNALEIGARYIIVREENSATLGTQNPNNFSKASITITDGITTIKENSGIQILTLGGEAGAYTLETPAGTYLSSPSNNYLRTAASVSGNEQKWTITFTSEKNVTITNNSRTSYEIKYNSSASLFSCYSSGQLKCQLYKEVVDVPLDVPTFSPDGGTIKEGEGVTVTAVGSNATVSYKIDDASTWSGGTNTTETIALPVGTHTIKAKSVNGSEESSEVTKTFTVEEIKDVYYERIYSTDDLIDGEEYIILYRTDEICKTFGTWQSSKNSYTAIDITTSGDIAVVSDDDRIAFLTLVATTNGAFAIKEGSNYIGYSGSSTNLVTSSTLSSDKYRWKITISNGIALIQNVNTTTRYLGYGKDTTPVSFKAYVSGDNDNLQIFAKRRASFNISKWNWGTYYDERAYTMPDGVTGYTIVDGLADKEALSIGTTYEAGDIVPGHTALLLHGDGGDSGKDYAFNFYYSADKPANYNGTENLLHGSMKAISADQMLSISGVSENSYYFYKLTTKDGKDVGFYWGEATGAPFAMAGAHKCYLVLPQTKAIAARGFALDFENLELRGTITALPNASIVRPASQTPIYDLQGRRVVEPLTPGIYIVGGQKVIIR